eukprot:15366901-Ditylum_brightwellii.AAC.1
MGGGKRQVAKVLAYFYECWFVSPKDDEDNRMAEIWKVGLSTEMVDDRMAWGGLQCPDIICWNGFAYIQHLYSTIATPENIVSRGEVNGIGTDEDNVQY